MAATHAELQPADTLGRILTYITLIDSTNRQTTETGYINRNSTAFPDKSILRREWSVFLDLIEVIKPHIMDTYKKVKINNKTKMVDFTTKRGTQFQIEFTTVKRMEHLTKLVSIKTNTASAGDAFSIMAGVSDDIAKEAKKRKLI